MYVPPYEALLNAFGISKADVEKEGTVTISLGLFKMLLQFAVSSSDFTEEAYLNANPDVAEAVRCREIANGFTHYAGFGYFEGRRDAIPFDEDWYLSSNPDIQLAINRGQVQSGSDHFYHVGAGEGRSPNAVEKINAVMWKRALNKL
jgi:hypothetical protein